MSVAENPLAEARGGETWKATYPSGQVQTFVIFDLDGELYVTRDYYIVGRLAEFQLPNQLLAAHGVPTWERVA